MAILYRIPSIGKAETGYAQKGPTCWYYAAKMLLKFHQKLEKSPENRIYEEFKQLHELRKVLTELGGNYESHDLAKLKMARRYDNMRAWSKEEVEAIIEKKKTVLLGCGLDQETIKKAVDEVGLRAAVDRQPDPVIVERLRKGVQILDEKIGEGLSRLELLSNFVSGAGFVSINETFSNAEDIEAVLRKFGPVYAAGGLTLTKKRVKMTPAFLLAMETNSVSADELEYIHDLDPKSSHAVVVCGVRGDSVSVIDPNASNKCAEVDLKAFIANVNQIITISCEGCTHLKLQEMPVS
jgi:hypothetical protein